MNILVQVSGKTAEPASRLARTLNTEVVPDSLCFRASRTWTVALPLLALGHSLY